MGFPLPKERDIQRQLLQWLRLRGVFCWRQNSGALVKANGRPIRFNGAEGCSDILGLLPGGRFAPPRDYGVPLAVEVKRPGQKPTLKQSAFLEAFRGGGGIAIVATSIGDVESVLSKIGYLATGR